MNPEITIRKAVLADTAVLAEFNQGIALETEGIRLKSEVITAGVSNLLKDDSRGFYLIAEIGGKIAGALMVTREWSDWRNGEFWWIQSVYVKSVFRRRGVYSALYNFLQEYSKAFPDVCGFRLYVEKDNRPARETYEKLGMHETAYRLYETEVPGKVWRH